MIQVTEEPDIGPPLERCCFCRKNTKFWYKSKHTRDVACCKECAARAEPEDVPTKDQWCRRERIAEGPGLTG